MIFWIGITLALIAGGWAAKRGLYEAWALLFNLVIAVYLGMTVGPVLQEILEIETATGEILAVFGTAVICLAVLYGISYVAFLGQFNITLPKILDKGGGGLLGFLAGLFAWSFVAFLVFISPLGQSKLLERAGFNSESMQDNISYMSWWTQKVHNMVCAEKQRTAIKDNVAGLIENAGKNAIAGRHGGTQEQPRTSQESVETAAKETEPKPSDLGPPPELNFEDI